MIIWGDHEPAEEGAIGENNLPIEIAVLDIDAACDDLPSKAQCPPAPKSCCVQSDSSIKRGIASPSRNHKNTGVGLAHK